MKMFFSKDKNKKNKKSDVGETSVGQRLNSDQIREQALANARAARERLGEDYINEMAAILKKQQIKLTPEQAKAKIKAAHPDRVAANVKDLLEEKD